MLDVLQVELLASDQSKDPSGGADHNVGAVGLEHLLVLGDGETAEKYADLKWEGRFKCKIGRFGDSPRKRE